MNNNVVITEAIPEDAQTISLIRRKTWLTTYPNKKAGITIEDIEECVNKRTVEEESRRRAERIVNNKDTHLWIAKINSKIVGFIEVQKLTERNRIRALYILSEYQNHGIGTALMQKTLRWFSHEKDITCEVASYNTQAISFYKKFGFIENGVTQNEISKLPNGKSLPEIEMVKTS